MIFRGLSTRPGHTRAQLPHPWRAVGSTVGSAVGRRVGNPVGHGGERGGESAARRKVGSAVESARGGWGFCTIRSIAAACRRRVASLLTQFPPRDREGSGKPRGARWGGERGTPWGTAGSAMGRIVERAMGRARGGWGFCTIRRIATACRRRVASLLTQFPPRGGRRARNPADTPRRSSLTRGTRCRTRGKHGREVRSCPHGQRSGSAPTRTPAPAVSQVSHRSFDHPSGAPDPE